MNTGKRILSVLMCIAMLISMMTTFAAAEVAEDAGSVEQAPVADVNTLTGAKPTTNVAAPTVSKDVFVVDSTVTAETTGYVLNWDGQEYSTYDVDGVATDMFVYGVNLFATIADAQAVAPVGATYLVKSVTYSAAFGNSGVKQKFTKAGNFYTEAYNTMPYVVGTAFDGSDWTLNQDYVAKSVILNGIDFVVTDAANSGEFNLYGFSVNYGSYAIDLNNSTVPVNVKIQNTYYLPTDSGSTSWFNMSTHARLENTAASSFEVKNFYLGGSTSRFTSEYVTNTFIVDGFYVPADVDMGSTPYIKHGLWGYKSNVIFRNWNMQNEEMNIYFQGNNLLNYNNIYKTPTDTKSGETQSPYFSDARNFRSITVEDSTFNNSGLMSVAKLALVHGNALSHYKITGIRAINTTGTTAYPIYQYNKWNDHLSLTMADNYFQGYQNMKDFGDANVGTGALATGIVLGNNYLTDGSAEQGVQLCVGSKTNNKNYYAQDWYVNPAMTLKASELIGNYASNAVAKSKLGMSITLYVGEGETASLRSNDATLSSDADLEALAAGTYTVNATRTIDDVTYTVPYTVTVIGFTYPLIQNVADETGLIDKHNPVIILDSDTTNDAADGELVEVEWKGETYSAVKGATAFANLDTLKDYVKANGITNPNVLVKSALYNGASTKGDAEFNTFTADLPAKYFTQNYDKKPYTASDRALDPTGSEWASNVNTGAEDSFNTADGFKVKWLSFNTAVAGRYEFYGFTLSNCIQAQNYTRSDSIDVHIENLYVPSTSSGLFVTSGSSLNAYSTANTFKDKMYVKNVYLDGTNGTAKNGLFENGNTYLFTYMTLDGVFADFGGYVSGSNHWIDAYYDDHCFTIKNSNLRNAQDKIMFEGDNGKGVNKGKADATYREFEKKMILENNIFYNFTFSTEYTKSSFMYIKNRYHTTLLFNDNFVYTGRDAAINLFSGDNGGDRQPNAYITVNNNTLLGINDTYNAGRWVSTVAPHTSKADNNYVTSAIIAEEDLLAGNVTAAGDIFNIPNSNHNGGVKNYIITDKNAWLDYARTTKAADATNGLNAYVQDGGFYINSKSGKTINATIYLPSTISAADITVCDTAPVWYDLEGNEVDATEITKDSVNVTDDEGNVIGVNYVLKVTTYVGSDENPIEITYTINANVIPNTIVAYGQSEYEKVEAGEVDGKMTYTMYHPSETEVFEDMPHISGGFYDDYAMINSLNASIIDGFANYSGYKHTIKTGEYKVYTWMGMQYIAKFGETLYQNVDTAYTTETNAGNMMPEYLLSVGEWGWTAADGFYGGVSGSYILRSPGKFFTENYAIDPYYPGDEYGNDWTSNIGTDYGMFNPDIYCKAAYIKFENDAKEGRYELYGFTVGVGVSDGRTTNNVAIDLYMKNTYFSCEGANSYIFYGNESTNDALMGGSPDSKMYVENAYVASKGARSFLRNSAWSDITFDKVYADFAENTKSGYSYFHQTYNETQLVIKNSFFTNTLKDSTMFEGYNKGTNYYNDAESEADGDKWPNKKKDANFEAGRKAIVLENNIFKDYSFGGTASFLNVKGGYLSEIVLRNNYIDNAGNNMAIFAGLDGYLDGVDPEMNLIVEDNTFIGFSGKVGYNGSRVLAETSSINGNYAADEFGAMGKAITTDDGNKTAGYYYLDSLKEITSTDLEITSWTTSGVNYEFIGNEVIVEKTTGTPSISGIETNGNVSVYANSGLTEQIDDLAQVGTSYVKVSAANSEDTEVYILYTVTVLGTSDNFFADKYTAPAGETIKTPIDPSKAVIIDIEAQSAKFGEVVTLTWMGKEYDFIKGITAFESYEAFVSYAKKVGMTEVHALMKTVTISALGASYAVDLGAFGTKAIGELNIQVPGCYYTENYNIKPYTVTDGVWAKNDAFDPAKGIVTRWLKVNNNLGAATVEVYGFAVTNQFQNTGENGSGTKTEATDFYVENGYAMSVEGYSPSRTPFTADNFYVRQAANPAGGSFVAKNVYIESNGVTRTLLTQSNYTSEFVLDGIFVDNKGAEFYDRTTEDKLDEAKVILEGDSSITIKNSYASGFAYSTRFVVLTEGHDYEDNRHAITFENNEFYNVTFAGNDAFIQVDGDYTDVTLVNNKIVNEYDCANVVEVIEYYEFEEIASEEEGVDPSFAIKANNTISTIPLTLTIENNTLIGFGNETTVERKIAAASSLAGNCVALVGQGGKQLTIVGENRTIVDATFKVDEDGSLSPSEIYSMTINGVAFDGDGATANVEVKYNKKSINLYEYLVNDYNVVEVYADADFTEALDANNIAIDTAAVYLKVMSPDMSKVETRIVNFTIGEAPAVAVEAVSATLYNDISMNFKTVGTEVYDNVYVDFTLNGVSTSVSDFKVEGDYVVYNFDNIAPHLMNETIKVDIYADVEGTAAVIATYETSLASYLYDIKEAYADDAFLTELAIDALNYGAAAQTYKKFNVENLANANLTEDEQFIEDILADDLFSVEDQTDKAAVWASKGLYLDEAIDIKLGFTTTENIEDLTVKVEAADGSVQYVDTFVRRNGKYYIYFDGFNVAQVDDVFTFTVMKGETAISAPVVYGVQCYAATAIEQGTEDLQNIVKAMMLFGRSALAYSENI